MCHFFVIPGSIRKALEDFIVQRKHAREGTDVIPNGEAYEEGSLELRTFWNLTSPQ
jgi:hypothetical protein